MNCKSDFFFTFLLKFEHTFILSWNNNHAFNFGPITITLFCKSLIYIANKFISLNQHAHHLQYTTLTTNCVLITHPV